MNAGVALAVNTNQRLESAGFAGRSAAALGRSRDARCNLTPNPLFEERQH